MCILCVYIICVYRQCMWMRCVVHAQPVCMRKLMTLWELFVPKPLHLLWVESTPWVALLVCLERSWTKGSQSIFILESPGRLLKKIKARARPRPVQSESAVRPSCWHVTSTSPAV